jgi:hypothetical protein
LIAINARVRIPSLGTAGHNGVGTITYVNWAELYSHNGVLFAIQVTLDEPLVRAGMNDEVRVWRTNTHDCEILNEEGSA